jgi:hypothetical protein
LTKLRKFTLLNEAIIWLPTNLDCIKINLARMTKSFDDFVRSE